VVAAMIEAIRFRARLTKWTAVKHLYKSKIVWCISVIADKRSCIINFLVIDKPGHADRHFVKLEKHDMTDIDRL
jgi:hypothetical protein